MAQVKFYKITNSNLNSLAIVDGQLIFVTDTKKAYLDSGDVRIPINGAALAAGNRIDLTIDGSTYVLNARLYDANNNLISTSSNIDLPIEQLVMNVTYDENTKELVITLQNGNVTRVPVSSLIDGLVKNTDYATSSKAGIVKAANQFNVNNSTGAVSAGTLTATNYNSASNDTFIGKGTLENVITNKIYTKTQVDNIVEPINDKLNGDSINNTTGTNITINDTIDAPLNIELKPSELEQVTTTGKNLFNINGNVNTRYNGETSTNNTVNGNDLTTTTNGSSTHLYGQKIYVGTGTTITFSFILKSVTYTTTPASDTQVAYVSIYNDNTVESQQSQALHYNQINQENAITFTPQTDYIYVTFGRTSQTTNATFTNIQVEIGNTATSYEPYTGAIPSPNPNYPQDIHTISGNNEIKVVGKNLLPVNSYNSNIVRQLEFNFNLPVNTYTISFDLIDYTMGTNTSMMFYMGLYYDDRSQQQITLLSINSSTVKERKTLTFTTTSAITPVSISNIRISESAYNNGGRVIANNIQIEKGATVTSYEPYQEQTLSINLPVENLFNINGNVNIQGNDGTTVARNSVADNILTSQTNSASSHAVGQLFTNLNGKTFTFSAKVVAVGSGLGGGIFIYDNGVYKVYKWGHLNETISVTYTATSDNVVCTFVTQDGTGAKFTNIQVELGDKANSYTPYGTTRLEYCKIGDYSDVFMKPSRKNLFDIKSWLTENNVSYIENDDGSITFATKLALYENPLIFSDTDKNVSLSGIITNGTATNVRLQLLNSNDISQGVINSSTLKLENKSTCKLRLDYDTAGTVTMKNIQLEKGSIATEYEPYNPDGKWYLKKNIGKVVLDGSNITWSVYNNTLYNLNCLDNAGVLYSNRVINGMCNRVDTNVGTNIKYADNTCKGLQFYNVDTYWGLTNITSNAFNTYLEINNVIIYYSLATPQYILLNDTLQTQLNAIEYAKSYDSQTNISQINNDLPFIFNITNYKHDVEGMYDAINKRIDIEKGAVNGIATLDETGKLEKSQLPLGETDTTAYPGDKGAAAYAHAVTNKGSAFASGLYKVTTNTEGHVTNATAVTKADITGLGIPGTASNGVKISNTDIQLDDTTYAKLNGNSSVANTNVTSLTRTDLANDAPMKIELKPNTSQYTTTGKNLFNNNQSSAVNSGTTEAKIDTGKRITSTTTNTYAISVYVIKDLTLDIGKTVRLKCNMSASASNRPYYSVGICDADGTNRTNKIGTSISGETLSWTVTGLTDTKKYLYVMLSANSEGTVVVNDYVDYTNIVLTIDNSDMTYEPYTGGIASPNPDYPQNIHVVSGDNEITICGKNLLNPESEIGTIDSTTGVNTASNTAIRMINYIDIGNASLIYFKQETSKNIKARWYDENKEYIGSTPAIGLTTDITVTPPTNARYLRLTVESTDLDFFANNKVILSTTATLYEPYRKQTFPIDLPVENLFDKTQVEDANYYINPTNGNHNSTNYNAKLYTMRVEQNTNYYRNIVKVNNTTVFSSLTYYDENMTFLSGEWNANNLISTPNNAKYMILSVSNDFTNEELNNYFNSLQIEQGTKVNLYTPYGIPALEYCKIGDYSDKLMKPSGKNLFNKESYQYLNANFNAGNDNVLASNSNAYTIYIPCKPNVTYTFSKNKGARFFGGYTKTMPALNVEVFGRVGANNSTQFSVTTNNEAKYLVAYIYNTNIDTGYTLFDIVSGLQIEEGLTATEYEPYNNGKWYLKKNINKVIFDGSEDSWVLDSSNVNRTVFYNVINDIDSYTSATAIPNLICNYFIPVQQQKTWVVGDISRGTSSGVSSNRVFFIFKPDTSLSNFKTWLSTHNTIVYYVLETPTYILLNNTLQKQLDSIQYALSYRDGTNINQINNDLPFVLDVTGHLDNINGRYDATIERIGQISDVLDIINGEEV